MSGWLQRTLGSTIESLGSSVSSYANEVVAAADSAHSDTDRDHGHGQPDHRDHPPANGPRQHSIHQHQPQSSSSRYLDELSQASVNMDLQDRHPPELLSHGRANAQAPPTAPLQPNANDQQQHLQLKLTQAVALLRKLKDENSRLTQQMADVESKQSQRESALQAEIQRLHIELEASQATDLQQTTTNRPKSSASNTDAELFLLRQLVNEKSAREEALQHTIADLLSKISARETANQPSAVDGVTVVNTSERLAESNVIQDKESSITADKDKAVATLNEQSAPPQQQVTKLLELIQQLNREKAELLEMIETSQQHELQATTSQTDLDLDMKIATMEEENGLLQSRLTELEHALIAERSNHEARLSNLENSHKEAVKQRALAEDKLAQVENALDESVASHQEELLQLVSKYKKSHMDDLDKITSLESQLAGLRTSSENTSNKVPAQQVQELQAQLESLQQSTSADIARLTQERHEILGERDDAVSQLQEALSALSSDNMTLASAKLEVEQELEAIKSASKSNTLRTNELESQLAHLSTDLHSSRAECDTFRQEVDSLRKHIADQETHVWRQQCDELEALVTQLRKQLDQASQDLHSRKDELATHIDSSHRREKDLQDRIQELESSLESSHSSSFTPDQTVADPSLQVLQRLHQEDAATIVSLEQDLNMLKDELVKEKQDAHDRINELRRRLQLAVQVGKKKAAEVEELKQSISTMIRNNSSSHNNIQSEALEMYKRDIAEVRKQSQLNAEEGHAYKTRVQELEGGHHGMLERIREFESENQDLKAQIIILERQVASLLPESRPETPATDRMSDATTFDNAKISSSKGISTAIVVDLLNALKDCRKRATDVAEIYDAYQSTLEWISELAGAKHQHSIELQKLQQDHVAVVEELSQKVAYAEEERERMENERTMIMERLTNMKNAIAPKLQAEIDESNRLRQQVASLTGQNDEFSRALADYEQQRMTFKNETESLLAERDSLQHKVTSLEQQLSSVTESYNAIAGSSSTSSAKLGAELDIAHAEAEKNKKDIARLKAHLLETEESFTRELAEREARVAEYARLVSELESERDSWTTVVEQARNEVNAEKEQAEELHDMVETLQEEMGILKESLRSKDEALINLQNVLAEFQSTRDSEIEFALEGMKRQLANVTASVQEARQRADDAEAKLAQSANADSQIARLEKELADRTEQVGTLRHASVQLQNHLNEALRRMRDAPAVENTVDRRLVSSLVVNFCAAPRSGVDKTRYEILRIMDGILKFTDDEKWKVGLGNRPRESGGSPGSSGTPALANSESFTDMWISFLLRESSHAATSNNGDDKAT
ncbi:hypothetical protein SeMB42_g04119 [Synchytrium endobioticum]|uniref:GRIP domain-containing protein n=1 Tax=Synchytrium endobioticum TaxID=286115 RepID=A0A507CKB0_9FUNG|nr:hypothetical protein SeLEV6574_g06720 [Synchytrium endobioticum]TPX45062.1 hypothetical protein SeMB42_g04119 [Synchytrium endobioticum]